MQKLRMLPGMDGNPREATNPRIIMRANLCMVDGCKEINRGSAIVNLVLWVSLDILAALLLVKRIGILPRVPGVPLGPKAPGPKPPP